MSCFLLSFIFSSDKTSILCLLSTNCFSVSFNLFSTVLTSILLLKTVGVGTGVGLKWVQETVEVGRENLLILKYVRCCPLFFSH